MKSGRCVKCGSTSVRMATNGVASQSGHTTMYGHSEGRRLGIVRPFQGKPSQLVCTACGYLEWWVLDPETIAFIEDRWIPVPAAAE